MPRSKARITAIGTYVPDRILSNEDLEKMVDTSDEWIVQRTGMRERRITDSNEFTSDLCIAAVENLIARYHKSVDDVDLIIVCTCTPDYSFPSVACQVQARFKMKNTGAIDVNAACAGFAYGLYLADGLITAGLNRKVLVIGAVLGEWETKNFTGMGVLYKTEEKCINGRCLRSLGECCRCWRRVVWDWKTWTGLFLTVPICE